MYDKVRVKKAKLEIIPIVIPKGFALPPTADEDNTMGKSGQIHGAAIVTKPDKKAKTNRRSI